MRTSIDVPDSLFREIKAAAAKRGESMKSFFLRAVRSELKESGRSEPRRVSLPLVESKAGGYNVSPERLAEIDAEDERNDAG